jgi:hypothetical protein
MNKVAVVTRSSSGIGYETSLLIDFDSSISLLVMVSKYSGLVGLITPELQFESPLCFGVDRLWPKLDTIFRLNQFNYQRIS